MFNSLFGESQRTPSLRPDGKRYLTVKQAQILDAFISKESRQEIATKLGLNSNTLGAHLRQIFQRLDVHTLEDAVARAYWLGYLVKNDYHNILLRFGHHQGDYRMFQTLCAAMRQLTPAPKMEKAGPLAQFGLALLLISSLVGREESARRFRETDPNVGVLVELDSSGKLRRRWEIPGIGVIRTLAIAPPAAHRQGFTPGHVFAVHDIPQSRLNRAAITELTPEGVVVRTFCGGDDVQTRLIGALCATFAPDGRLLVTSGWLTDGILAFSAGGSRVSRFANGTFQSVATSPNQSVVAVHVAAVGGGLMVFDTNGTVLDRLLPFHYRSPEELPAALVGTIKANWESATVDSGGRVLATRDHSKATGTPGCRHVDVMESSGEFLDTFPLPDINHGFLTTDRQDRLYAPCERLHRLSILSAEGELLHQVDLGPDISPFTVAVTANNAILVGGKLLES